MSPLSRRRLLKVGTLGAGLTLARQLRLEADGAVDPARAGRSGILVFLAGGPSHQDTFDLKPKAAAEYRGEFRPIATRVPGVEICEHLPRLADCADRYAIVRGLSHNLAAHGPGARYLMTGNLPSPLVPYPAYGSVVSRELPVARDLPAYVAVDHDDVGPGFLGLQHGALVTGEMPRAGQPFNVRGLSVDEDRTADLDVRRRLLEDLDGAFASHPMLDDEVRALDRFSARAHAIITSSRTREAFDLTRESPAIASRFGSHECGLSLLLALRLVSAGVRFVTVLVDGWDTHADNFATLRGSLLPRLDKGLSALLTTLDERDQLSSTAVMVTGEFGRTPKVNGRAGRDHWAGAMSALLAGGDIAAGRAIGATDDQAARPLDEGYSPKDLAATFYRNLGIDPSTEYQIGRGRPITLVRDGRVIEDALLA